MAEGDLRRSELFSLLSEGMNAAVRPLWLPNSAVAKAINVVIRDGSVRTRPAFVEEDVTIIGNKLQGVTRWITREDGDCLALVAEGILQVIKLDTMDITTVGAFFDISAPVYFVACDEYLLIQDGVSTPRAIYMDSGTPTLYTAGTIDWPTSTLMHFSHGRVHMVPVIIPDSPTNEPGTASIISSDILITGNPTNVFALTETDYLNEGFAHALPQEMGKIKAMATHRNASTGSGYGATYVMAEDGIAAYDFSIPRTSWKTTELSQVLFFGSGTESPYAVVNINSDVLYRGYAGIRTIAYSMSESTQAGELVNQPISFAMGGFFDNDSGYLQWVSAAFSDNRVFMTAYGTGDNAFKSLVVMDTEAASTFGGSKFKFDGFWTGMDFGWVVKAVVSGVEILYCVSADLKLYRLDPSVVKDNSTVPIEARIETKEYAFESYPLEKKLRKIDLWLSEIKVDTEIKVWIRPSGYPLWSHVGTKTIRIGDGSLPQKRSRIRFVLDAEDFGCDTISGRSLNCGNAFQLAIQWTGNCRVDMGSLEAVLLLDRPQEDCEEEESSVLTASTSSGEVLDDFSYSIGDD